MVTSRFALGSIVVWFWLVLVSLLLAFSANKAWNPVVIRNGYVATALVLGGLAGAFYFGLR